MAANVPTSLLPAAVHAFHAQTYIAIHASFAMCIIFGYGLCAPFQL